MALNSAVVIADLYINLALKLLQEEFNLKQAEITVLQGRLEGIGISKLRRYDV